MIKIVNISKKFDSNTALQDVSCEFENNKITTILGPSGSGKTTLIRCLNGLENIDQGEILFDNISISNFSKLKLAQKIGIVFQSFNLFHHMSVYENLVFAPKINLKLDKLTIHDKAIKLLEKFGIADKKDFLPANLSGGQKQRVAIARCMMMEPEIIIFDEPTSALDPESIKDIVNAIEELKNENITIIVVTHHVSFARKISDKIIFMDKGLILANQESTNFFKDPDSMRAKIYLESVGEYS